MNRMVQTLVCLHNNQVSEKAKASVGYALFFDQALLYGNKEYTARIHV